MKKYILRLLGKIENDVLEIELSMEKIKMRLNSLEVKNDSDELHDRINKEYLKTDIGVTAQEAMDNMNNALYEKCDRCNGTGEVWKEDVSPDYSTRRYMVTCSKCWGKKTLKKVAVSTEKRFMDLDRSAPIEVVLNMSKYQIQLLSNGKWIDTEITDELDLLAKLIPGINKYRYRIQEKKPIQITREIYNMILDNKQRATLNISDPSYRGQEIIIID